jgi:glutamate-ammonia-ligase adenylyltransferase
VDVEFLVQVLQLKYGRDRPAIRKANTWEALDALKEAGLLAPAEHGALRGSYDFLRRVQSRLRIVRNRAQDELPESMDDLEKLARRLGYEAAAEDSAGRRFLAELEQHTVRTREMFLGILERERPPRG